MAKAPIGENFEAGILIEEYLTGEAIPVKGNSSGEIFVHLTSSDVTFITDNYTQNIDEPDASTLYTGLAVIGTSEATNAWQIKKLTVTGTVTKIAWADGNDDFDNIWNNRAALTYT